MNRSTIAVTLMVLAAFGMAAAEQSWPTGWTSPNQGTRLARSGSSIFFVFDAGDVKLTYSTNSGTSWSATEHVNFGDPHFGDGMGCLTLDGNNRPWMMAWHPTTTYPPLGALSGSVRRGAGDYNFGDLGIGGGTIFSLSLVMSPSGGSSPMVYGLASVLNGAGDQCNLVFFAWDTSGAGSVPTTWVTQVVASRPYDPGYDYRLVGAIAVSASSGNDTVHITYQTNLYGGSRVMYVKSTNQVNPARIRSGIAPTWSLPIQVSTSATEPATNPVITYDADSVFVAWRGPYSQQVGTGEIWRKGRRRGMGWTVEPVNVSQSPSVESDRPTLSTRWGTSWHEYVSTYNYDIKTNLGGNVITVKATPEESRYPHIAVVPPGSIYQIVCHAVWTEGNGTYYKKCSYVPALMGGDGGEDAGLVRPGEGQLEMRVSPNPSPGRVEFAFDAASTGPGRMSVVDVNGCVRRTLSLPRVSPGRNVIRWDGRDENGVRVGPGTYVCRLAYGESVRTATVTLTK